MEPVEPIEQEQWLAKFKIGDKEYYPTTFAIIVGAGTPEEQFQRYTAVDYGVQPEDIIVLACAPYTTSPTDRTPPDLDYLPTPSEEPPT